MIEKKCACPGCDNKFKTNTSIKVYCSPRCFHVAMDLRAMKNHKKKKTKSIRLVSGLEVRNDILGTFMKYGD